MDAGGANRVLERRKLPRHRKFPQNSAEDWRVVILEEPKTGKKAI